MPEIIEISPPSPNWKQRLLAASYYCGAAPLIGHLRSRRESPFADHHYGQALALCFVALVILAAYIIESLFLSWVLVFRREWYEDTWLEPTLLMIVRRAFLCWIVFWVFSVAWALLGSWRPIPFVGRLARYTRLMRFSVAGYGVAVAAILATGAIAIHAQALVRNDAGTARAYLVYDDLGFVPEWAFNLGFYPIARAAIAKWGEGSAVVTPLTKESLARALHEGDFVFVLSHGKPEGLLAKGGIIRPSNAVSLGTGERLRYVYITGCDSGTLQKEWESNLAPAKVITFDRLSAWLEHIYWLLFKGAAVVRSLR